MSQTVVLEQTVATETITLKFDDCASNVNPSPTTDSKPDQQNRSPTNNPIPIPNVGSEIEAVVNEFLKKHESSDEEVRAEAMNDLKSFIERHEIATETLLVLAKFAYDINNTDLLGVICQRVADVIKDKKVEEVREIFNITNDFTPEEEQAIRDEHAWAFED